MVGTLHRLPLTFGGEPALGMSVRCASTANVTISTGLNSGDTIDGVTLANGDLVLLKDQTSTATNGIYLVGATPVRWRAFDRYNDHPGRIVSVEQGTANADTLWLCTSNRGGTLGTTALAFSRLPGVTSADFSAYLDAIFTGEANGDLLGRTGGSWTNRTLASVLGDMLTTRGDMIRRGSSAVERLALGSTGAPIGSDGTDLTYLTAAQLFTFQSIVASSYTPTLTNVANLDSSTATTTYYIRVGSMVVVWGIVTLDATAAASTVTTIDISLPVASNFAAQGNCAGVILNASGGYGRIVADTTNDRATGTYLSLLTSAANFAFVFGYVII